jgi:hypothetical protein
MSWNLTCRKVRRSLALLSGNDLGEADQVALERHLAVCPDCRTVWQRLQTGQQALEQVRTGASGPRPLEASVWPAVERFLEANRSPAHADWRGWLPTGALAAACLTLFLLIPPVGAPLAENGGSRLSGAFLYSVGAPVDVKPGPSKVEREWVPDLSEAPRVRTLLDGTDVRDL